jgi:hypothetical protein
MGKPRASIQRSLPVGPGLGYQWVAENGWQSGIAQWQTSAGRFELRHDQGEQLQMTSASAAGSLVVVDRSVYLTRPIDDAFALVRVGGLKGVRTYASNQLVGRTNARGELLVPSLASYATSRLTIDERDVPLTVDVPRVGATAVPGLRAAAVVSFPVRELRRISGRFVRDAVQGTSPLSSTLGVFIRIQLNRGSSASFNPRTLQNGTEILNYNLYLDSARTSIWGDGTGGTIDFTDTAAVLFSKTATIYGRVPAGQDAGTGNYSDSLVATIVF